MAETTMFAQEVVEMPAPTPDKPPVKRASIETIVENLEQAKICKQEGNALYNDGQIKPAIRKYHQCLLHLKACHARYDMPQLGPSGPGLDKDTQAAVDKVQAECYNNLAACLLKQPKCDYNRVVQYCNSALRLQPNNIKAVFRKAVAYYNMGDCSVARRYLNDAMKMRKAPDAMVKKYLKLCTEAESSNKK